MKNNAISTVLMVVIGICSLFLVGCANNPQLAYRGRMNAPGVNLTYLRVDPNAAYHMSPDEYKHLQQVVRDHNDNVRQMLENDRMAAQNAQIWTGDVNRDRYNSLENVIGRSFSQFMDRWINSIEF